MSYVKWTLALLLLGAYAAVLHYSLPSRDIVRVLGTEVVRVAEERTDPEGREVLITRDQMRINTITPEGGERVYRNEDTDWSFPWYFKFDSANVAARAENLKSTESQPAWVVVTHYGWRIPMLSWFPNAIDLDRAERPDQDLTPWVNIVVVTLLSLGLITLWRLAQLAFRRNVDPVLDEIEARGGAVVRFWRGLWR